MDHNLKLIQTNRLTFMEGPNPGPAQRGQMAAGAQTLSHVPHQGPDIGSFAAGHLKIGAFEAFTRPAGRRRGQL